MSLFESAHSTARRILQRDVRRNVLTLGPGYDVSFAAYRTSDAVRTYCDDVSSLFDEFPCEDPVMCLAGCVDFCTHGGVVFRLYGLRTLMELEASETACAESRRRVAERVTFEYLVQAETLLAEDASDEDVSALFRSACAWYHTALLKSCRNDEDATHRFGVLVDAVRSDSSVRRFIWSAMA